jgi:hypothetical protein
MGILVAEAGTVLVGFAEWDPMETGARAPFYAAELFLLAVGIKRRPAGHLSCKCQRR